LDCPNIDGLTFSQVSIDAIEEIRKKQLLADVAVVSISMGTWANIFVGNGMLEMSYSLTHTDFEDMAKNMATVPRITQAMVEKIADMTYLRVSDHKEKQFWAAVSYGCSINQEAKWSE